MVKVKFLKTALKLNSKDYTLEPCAVPEEAVQYSADPNRVFPCARCDNEVLYADSYASLFLLAENGFGYCICKGCWQKECRELHDTHHGKEVSKS